MDGSKVFILKYSSFPIPLVPALSEPKDLASYRYHELKYLVPHPGVAELAVSRFAVSSCYSYDGYDLEAMVVCWSSLYPYPGKTKETHIYLLQLLFFFFLMESTEKHKVHMVVIDLGHLVS